MLHTCMFCSKVNQYSFQQEKDVEIDGSLTKLEPITRWKVFLRHGVDLLARAKYTEIDPSVETSYTMS